MRRQWVSKYAVRLLCVRGRPREVVRLAAVAGDYLVDALCRQLRHLHTHPHAPQLFAALLRHTGAAPQLLSLLAEPARAAIAGLQARPHQLAKQIRRGDSKSIEAFAIVYIQPCASSEHAEPLGVAWIYVSLLTRISCGPYLRVCVWISDGYCSSILEFC